MVTDGCELAGLSVDPFCGRDDSCSVVGGGAGGARREQPSMGPSGRRRGCAPAWKQLLSSGVGQDPLGRLGQQGRGVWIKGEGCVF